MKTSKKDAYIILKNFFNAVRGNKLIVEDVENIQVEELDNKEQFVLSIQYHKFKDGGADPPLFRLIDTKKMIDLEPSYEGIKINSIKKGYNMTREEFNECVKVISSYDDEMFESFSEAFEDFLEGLACGDFFGTERQLDPRGDGRDA